jgi:hypothetical protein
VQNHPLLQVLESITQLQSVRVALAVEPLTATVVKAPTQFSGALHLSAVALVLKMLLMVEVVVRVVELVALLQEQVVRGQLGRASMVVIP